MSKAKCYNRVLAALDSGITQQYVAEQAIMIAEENRAHLAFAHVIDIALFDTYGPCFDLVCTRITAQMEEKLSKLLEKARASKNIPTCELIVDVGRVSATLTKQIATDFEPDLVVCGSGSSSSLTRTLFGDVTTALIRDFNCDVLVVKQS